VYIIIAGMSRLGRELALSLADRGHDVVVIDQDEETFAGLGSGFNGVTVSGLPFDEEVLQQAGIDRADAVAAVTGDDNVNVMVSQIAKKLYAIPHVLTRISEMEKVETFQKMGFDVICPTAVAASSAETILTGGAVA